MWREVAPQLRRHLLADKADLQKKIGHVGHLHWKAFKERCQRLAPLWLDRFFSGPLMFFLHLPRPQGMTRLKLVKELVRHLESSPRVRHGFDRRFTSAVLDFDEQDRGRVEPELVWRFGLADARMMNDRSEPLLQLCDVLLGLCIESYHGHSRPPSKAEARRQIVRAHAVAKARHQARTNSRKRNWVAAVESHGTLQPLLLSA